MGIFNFTGIVSSPLLDAPLGTARFFVLDGRVLLASDAAKGVIYMTLNNGSVAQADIAYLIDEGATLQTVEWNAGDIQFNPLDLNGVFTASSDSSLTIYANNSGAHIDEFQAVSFSIDDDMYVTLAASADNGIATYQVAQDGTFTQISFLSGSSGGYTDAPASLSLVEVAGNKFLISVSSTDDSITSFSIDNSGALTPVSTLGVEQFLPISTPQDVSSLTLAGETFLVVASSGSNSLTVLTVDDDGTLAATDQVADDLGSRIRDASVVETFTIDDRGFVLAAGSDSGISLYGLMPDGSLMHLDTVVDEIGFPIDQITDMHVAEVDGEYQLFTASATEAGLGQFSLSLDSLGLTATVDGAAVTGTSGDDLLIADNEGQVLSGAAGDDVLKDGLGTDTMTGGAGSDLFVLTSDGATDTITDFEIGVDKLDLSGLGFYNNPNQLTITPTSDGATVEFNGDTLVIKTANGSPLGPDDFTLDNTSNATHVDTSFVINADGSFGPQTTVDVTNVDNSFTNVSGQTGDSGNLVSGDADDNVLWGDAGNQTIAGADGHDVLRGGDGGDFLQGGDGIDLADYADATSGVTVDMQDTTANTGFAVGDTFSGIEGVTGSAHSDTLNGDANDNVLFAGASDDVLRGMDGDDRLVADDGDDWVDGGTGDDILEGGAGDDALLGRVGNDEIFGGAGNDNIAAHQGDDRVYGGGGDDNLGGSYGDDFMFGGSGNDVIGSGAQDDYIEAGLGDDVASGGWGSDEVYGGDGSDTLAGSYGDDIVRGGAGDDSIGGGTGSDQMFGDDGDDLIGAGHDDDFVFGGAGNDFLGGGSGDDMLFGGEGDDKFNGGTGDDEMSGGAGADTYVFNSFDSGEVDVITDFEIGTDILRMRRVAGQFDGLEIENVTVDGQEYAEISYSGHKIRLADINATDITADDFLFVG